jgi:hypothetical protein
MLPTPLYQVRKTGEFKAQILYTLGKEEPQRTFIVTPMATT